MHRNRKTYPIASGQIDNIKVKMLNWSKQFGILLFLDSNGYNDRYSKYECLLAAGALDVIQREDLEVLQEFHNSNRDWLFGHIAYDYKNILEPKLTSCHQDKIGFDELFFFRPETICYIPVASNELVIETTKDAEEIYNAIMHADATISDSIAEVSFTSRTSKDKYLNDVECLREHIRNGDCYEINYCVESYTENVHAEPLHIFHALNQLSKAPFAAYYRNGDKYAMCASPERYLQKNGSMLMSQPIKGTARRGHSQEEDDVIKQELYTSIKDRAENVMITDLVRNDLARSCKIGSVKVEELFGIYTFPQVHQMISTITGDMKDEYGFTDAIKYSFPMGSMTGAPKIKVMQLTEQYEDTCRGLFSGTVGYITPDGDFDFNVMIRSLYYNASSQYLSYKAGGAITYDSTAEGEWEEMRLKSWAMERIFKQD